MFFIFSRWQLAIMLNFEKHKILYADAVGRNKTHHHAKFSQKWSILKAEILQFFNFPNGRRHHLSFLKSPIANGVHSQDQES